MEEHVCCGGSGGGCSLYVVLACWFADGTSFV